MDDEQRKEILANKTEAQRLLEHPLFQRFLEDEKQQCFKVFCSMKASSTLEEFQFLANRVDAVNKLEASLKQHLNTALHLELSDKQPDEI